MNRELMKKWIAALRSGEYAQGKDYLYHPDENGDEAYCCLGVLQAIEPRIEQNHDGDEILDDASLAEFLGVGLGDGFDQTRYAHMNDQGVRFPHIADVLESEWLEQEAAP